MESITLIEKFIAFDNIYDAIGSTYHEITRYFRDLVAELNINKENISRDYSYYEYYNNIIDMYNQYSETSY